MNKESEPDISFGEETKSNKFREMVLLAYLMGKDLPVMIWDVSKEHTENFLYTHWLPVRITNTVYRTLNFSPITLGRFPTLPNKDCVMDPNNRISIIDGFMEGSVYRQ